MAQCKHCGLKPARFMPDFCRECLRDWTDTESGLPKNQLSAVFAIRGARYTADEVARLLLNEYIDANAADSIGRRQLGEAESERYRAKMRLYRLALVLLVLKTEEQRHRAFEAVTVALEQSVFPGTQDEGVPVLIALQTAMRDLGALISSNGVRRELFWAKDWLSGIGIEEFNPARLALLSMHWMDSFATVNRMIRQFSPESM